MIITYPAQLTSVAVLASFTFGYGIAGLNSCMEVLAQDLGWCGENRIFCGTQDLYAGIVNGSLSLGAAFGAYFAGQWAVDGRRKMLMVADMVACGGAFFCGIPFGGRVMSFLILLLGRSMLGVAVGMFAVLVPMFISESVPKDRRGSLGVLHQFLVVIGILIAILCGIILTSPPSSKGIHSEGISVPPLSLLDQIWWRFMQWFAMIPVIIQLLMFQYKYTDETPSHDISTGNEERARKTLELVYPLTQVDEVYNEIYRAQTESERNNAEKITIIRAIRSPYYRIGIFIGATLAIFQQLSGINMIMSRSNDVFANTGMSGKFLTPASCVMALVNVLMTVPSIKLVETKGRRFLLLLGYLGQTGSMALAFFFSIGGGADWISYMIVLFSTIFVGFFAIAAGPVTWIYLSEIYPIEVRSSAMGFATTLNWMTSFFVVLTSAQITNTMLLYGTLALSNLAGYLFVFKYVCETRGTSIENSPIYAGRHRDTSTASLLPMENTDNSVRAREIEEARQIRDMSIQEEAAAQA